MENFMKVQTSYAGHGKRADYELSSLARTLWPWVRIPLSAWMFGVYVRLFCVYVVLYLGRGLATDQSLVQGVLPIVYRSNEKWKTSTP
jgi:hypothetical protein